MNYFAQSPYASLAASLFGPTATARAGGAAANQIGAAVDPAFRTPHLRQRGVETSLFDLASPAGAASAARQAAPIAQSIDDATANANWNLQRSAANEGFANAAYGLLGRQLGQNQRFGNAGLSLLGSLFG